jgi:hypothetical protein
LVHLREPHIDLDPAFENPQRLKADKRLPDRQLIAEDLLLSWNTFGCTARLGGGLFART